MTLGGSAQNMRQAVTGPKRGRVSAGQGSKGVQDGLAALQNNMHYILATLTTDIDLYTLILRRKRGT